MFELIEYKNDDDSCPILEFIDSLDMKDKAKIYVILKLLKERGFLPFPYSSDVKGYPKLRELRIQSSGKKIRILHFYISGKRIILLHGFIKRDDKDVKRNNEIGYSRLLNYSEKEAKNGKKK